MVKRWLRTAAVLFLPLFFGVAGSQAAPGDFLASFGADSLNYPLNGVGLDAAGKVYVNDYGNGDLKIYDPSFKLLESWDATHTDREYPQYSLFLNPHSLTVRGDRVYVAIPAFGVVKAFSLAGDFLFDIASPAELACPWQPSGLATDADGNVYVTDIETDSVWATDPDTLATDKQFCGRQVVVLTADGKFLRTIGSWGSDPDQTPGSEPGTLGYPESVAVDGRGQVYVADQHRVVIYAKDGTWLRTIDVEPPMDATGGDSMAVAVDGAGRIYVTDAWNHRVQVFAQDGAILATWGGAGAENGRFNVPMGATLDPANNRLFVTDMWNHRIQVLEAFSVDACAGYRFGRFLAPVSLDKPFAAGSTIPVKFRITDGCGTPANGAQVAVSLLKSGVLARTGTTLPAPARGSYHFNVRTRGLAAGDYTLMVALPDGSRQTRGIKLR